MKRLKLTPFTLTLIGAFGVGVTAFLSARGTLRANEKLQRERSIKMTDIPGLDRDEKLDAIMVVAPSYFPAILSGTATLFCIFGANTMSKRQQASLASAYAMLDRSFREYREKVKELIGEDQEGLIRSEIAKEHYTPGCFDPGPGEQLFYDYTTGEYFESSFLMVVDAEYQLNRKLALEGCVSLREYCDMMGIDSGAWADQVGWTLQNEFSAYSWIEFEHELVIMPDGLECYIIHMPYMPERGFRDYM